MTSRNKRELDTVFDTRHELGEGIIWDEETEQLIWFDINNHQLFLGSPDSRTHISRFSLTSLWRQVFWHLNHNCLLPLPLGLSAMTDRQAVQPPIWR